MIRVTKMDGKEVMLNADWIQSVEATPDTLVTLTTGVQFIVLDSVEDVVHAFHIYKQKVLGPRLVQSKEGKSWSSTG